MKQLFAIIFSLMLSIGAVAQNSTTDTQPKADPSKQLQKLVQFYRYLVGFYIDEVDSEQLVEKAIVKMLSELDPHSTYIDADEMKGVREDFDGSFSGIGVEFRVMDDTIHVVNTIAGGPSAEVGIMPNDRIITDRALSALNKLKCPNCCAEKRAPKSTSKLRDTAKQSLWVSPLFAAKSRSIRSTRPI